MRSPARFAALFATTVLMLPWSGPLPAAGGGSMPSSSAPSFDPVAEYRDGVAALQASDFVKAKRAFDRVLSVNARDANVHYLGGLARAGLGDLKGARRFFEKAVRYDPNLIPAHQQLGITLAKLGDGTKAQEELALLKARAASCGEGCAQASELQAAIAAVEAAIGQGPQASLQTDPPLLFRSTAAGDRAYLDAVALINEKRYDAAIAALHAAERSFGPHPDILTYIGFAHRKLGRFDVAEAYYRRALTAAPDHKGATEYYGELMVERGDLRGARAMLAKLDAACAFGCAEAEELRRWIARGRAPES